VQPDDPTARDPGPLPGPGWYPDHRGTPRWWDGAAWSDRTRGSGVGGRGGSNGMPDGAAPRRARLLVGAVVVLVLFCVVTAATVLLLGAGSGPTASQGGPAAVVEANFAALREGDCAAYVATFSDADRQVMGDAFCRQSAVFGADGLGELVVGSTDVDGDTARVVGTFTDAGGEQSFAFDLVREDGGWAIVQ
jgi:hypothetical protein